MKSQVHPLRVLLKAIFLFAVINVIFVLADPPVGKITLYNHMIPGRLRFPYEQEPSFYFVGYNAPIYEDFNAMFGAHVISKTKSASEFRLILLGDSSTWGVSVQAGETLSEQINRLHIQTCDGRNLHAYNLGYPMPFLMRDVLVLDKAMEYQPDMVIWLITLSTLEPKTAETYFITPHAERYLRIANAYHLQMPHFSKSIQKTSFWDKTIIGQRKRLKNIIFTQALGVLWAATGIDNHEGLQPQTVFPSRDVDNNLSYDGLLPNESPTLFESLMLDVLTAGIKVAGDIPVILVNEPIFIANGKNHLIRYNGIYPRWIYNDYRKFMFDWAKKEDHKLLDYWNALPPEYFSDPNYHRNSSGEKKLAEVLAGEVRNFVCP